MFVPRELKAARLVGLKIMLLPQAAYGAGTDILGSRHRSTTPVSRAFRFGLQRGGNYCIYLLLLVVGFTSSTRLSFPDPVQSLYLETLAPERRSMAIDAQLIGDFQVLFAIGS